MNKSTSAPKYNSAGKSVVKTDEREDIFQRLKSVFTPIVPPFTIITDTDTKFEVVSAKPVVYFGARDSMYFGALIIQKAFVGLYLMHIYTHVEYVEKLGADLLKLKKGKSCFHIKKLDENLLRQVKKAIADGVTCYKGAGFI